jgi:hypothetical protein
MNERDILARLGKRNRQVNGEPTKPQLPELTLTGTPARTNHIRKGLGAFWFVCYPNRTYRPTEDDLKVFRDYIEKHPVKDGISTTNSKSKTKILPPLPDDK